MEGIIKFSNDFNREFTQARRINSSAAFLYRLCREYRHVFYRLRLFTKTKCRLLLIFLNEDVVDYDTFVFYVK